jgi:hypothetical protein
MNIFFMSFCIAGLKFVYLLTKNWKYSTKLENGTNWWFCQIFNMFWIFKLIFDENFKSENFKIVLFKYGLVLTQKRRETRHLCHKWEQTVGNAVKWSKLWDFISLNIFYLFLHTGLDFVYLLTKIWKFSTNLEELR